MAKKKSSKVVNDVTLRREVGVQIRTWRREGDMTQIDLAKAMQISQSTLSKIEAGQLEPGLLSYRRLCKLDQKFSAFLTA